MYAETGLQFPYFQNFSQEMYHLEEFSRIQKTNASRSNLVQTSTISEYDLGGEGDLFKAPEPIIEEPLMDLDPMTAAISMISHGENVISPQTMKVADIESFQNEQLLSEVFYDCKKDLLAKSAIEVEIPNPKVSAVSMVEVPVAKKDGLILEDQIQKSVSCGCLTSVEWMHGSTTRPTFLDFQGVDFEAAYGMRRAFSEGDIKTLGNVNRNGNLIHSPFERPLTIVNHTNEERRQKLSRYWKKKSKRNFGRTIKYACRKALADSQPRVRGRFAKTEESEVSKK